MKKCSSYDGHRLVGHLNRPNGSTQLQSPPRQSDLRFLAKLIIFLLVKQGKTAKKLRLRLADEGVQSGLSAFINDLQERRALSGIKTSMLITNTSGLRMSQQMLRNRWDEAREKAAVKAGADGDAALAVLMCQFQFKDIRPKAASEIELTHASRLLGHTTEEMTKKVYRRVGEIVKTTK